MRAEWMLLLAGAAWCCGACHPFEDLGQYQLSTLDADADGQEDMQGDGDVDEGVPPCVCLAGEQCCDGVCVNDQTDAKHCGGCGEACGVGLKCVGGQCVCPAKDGDVPCTSDQTCCGRYGCVDVNADGEHCGMCGHACEDESYCQLGKCLCAQGNATPKVCESGQACCLDVGCVDVSGDVKNCGRCGVVCENEMLCLAGKCGCPAGDAVEVCGDGAVCCVGAGCVNLEANSDHCGACDTACLGGMGCAGGQCRCGNVMCDTGLVCCGEGQCRESCSCTDAEGCNEGEQCCNQQCIAHGEDCVVCEPACVAHEVCLGGDCVCAAGYEPCGAQGCVATGTCALCGGVSCPSEQACCGGICVDLMTNDDFCGDCQMSCNALDMKCCDGECVALGTTHHCGACNDSCGADSTLGVALAKCEQGACAVELCVIGRFDCDGRYDNGCESGEPCVPCEGCDTDRCCQGQCVDLDNATNHCGLCGNACFAGQYCSQGVCMSQGCSATQGCASELLTCCDGKCVNTASDSTNCGGCTNKCAGAMFCVANQCVNANGT